MGFSGHQLQLRRGRSEPSCRKLIYSHYTLTILQYFYAPRLEVLKLGCNDCVQRRVYRHLKQLCILNGTISQLTTLHLTLQCAVHGLINVLRYMEPLQVLLFSIRYPSQSWEHTLEALASKPPTGQRPKWQVDAAWSWAGSEREMYEREKWCSSQTWHTNILPYLKYLGVQ